MKILLVNDDRIENEMIGLYLRAGGGSVVLRENAQEGLIALNAERPDVVITDWYMPVSSESNSPGWDPPGGEYLLRAVRAREPELPVIVLSHKYDIELDEMLRRHTTCMEKFAMFKGLVDLLLELQSRIGHQRPGDLSC